LQGDADCKIAATGISGEGISLQGEKNPVNPINPV
jgi:hypothetical protein